MSLMDVLAGACRRLGNDGAVAPAACLAFYGPMVQEIYLVRHGETLWNRAGRVQGRRDTPLTATGLVQMRCAAEALYRLIADPGRYAVVSSPLGRALESAAIICLSLGIDPSACRSDDLLREISWGEWEGLTRAEIKAAAREAWRRRSQDYWHFVPPGGESYAMGAERVRRWLSHVADGPSLIAVGHGSLGRLVRGLYAGLEPRAILALDKPHDALFRLSEGVVTRYDLDGSTASHP